MSDEDQQVAAEAKDGGPFEEPAPAKSGKGRYILALVTLFAVGAVAGLLSYTFIYAKGYSYLSNNPEACINCHVMEEQYDSWVHSSHHNWATCNDCHLPHSNIVAKYYVKAENGFWHALKFTTGDYPEHIRERPVSKDITNKACLYCHEDFTEDARHPGAKLSPKAEKEDEIFDCIRCHANVGHNNY